MIEPYRPTLAQDVVRALARWPDVPAAFGWLHLDRRGRWSMPDGEITHPGTLAFLRSHYGADVAGRWFVQNGPQRAYVTLELAPWVFSLDGAGELVAFNGAPVQNVSSLIVLDSGDLLLLTELGLGNVLDKDLGAFIDQLSCGEAGVSPDAVLAADVGATLRFRDRPLAVMHLGQAALPAEFGYQRVPVPDD